MAAIIAFPLFSGKQAHACLGFEFSEKTPKFDFGNRRAYRLYSHSKKIYSETSATKIIDGIKKEVIYNLPLADYKTELIQFGFWKSLFSIHDFYLDECGVYQVHCEFYFSAPPRCRNDGIKN